MIIDRTAGVTPTRFADRRLRQEIGALIGKADRDDMLRTFLWVSECRIAEEVCTAWKNHLDGLEREFQEADRRRAATGSPTWRTDTRDAITKACHLTSSTLAATLQQELNEAVAAHKECTQVLYLLSCRLGRTPTARVPDTDAAGFPRLDGLAVLRDQLVGAVSRLENLLGQDHETLHDLALQEFHRRQSAHSDSSVPLHSIDSMPASEFVSLVESLLDRAQFRTTRPGGANSKALISAVCPDGHTIVFVAHRVRGPRGWPPEPAEQMSATDVHTARLLGERGDPNLVVVVTNGGFSAPARRYAAEHDLHLLDRSDLQRWAEWQDPLTCFDDCGQDAA
ncbi:restriction endonuclease [Streptomyces sp. NRRL S-1824]|uniref:restriction endonuclease n=1 Tax=Streptomyces sp. NRRL S-1824 TaxID=1463889 RepID=UPI00131D06FE|nr:restriction endonuclease [Streptomyces sp. NRRL S-1824]